MITVGMKQWQAIGIFLFRKFTLSSFRNHLIWDWNIMVSSEIVNEWWMRLEFRQCLNLVYHFIILCLIAKTIKQKLARQRDKISNPDLSFNNLTYFPLFPRVLIMTTLTFLIYFTFQEIKLIIETTSQSLEWLYMFPFPFDCNQTDELCLNQEDMLHIQLLHQT